MRAVPASRFAVADFVGGLVTLDQVDDRLRARWQALGGQASEPNCFYEPWAIAPAAAHCGGRVQLLHAGLAESPTGIVPIVIEPRLGRWPIRHASAWIHDHCFLSTPLIARGQEQAAWRGLLAAADDSELPGLLSFPKLRVDGPVFAALEAICREQGRGMAVLQRHERALLETPASAEDYLADRLSGKKRKELRRLANRLGEEGTVTSEIFGPDHDLDGWIAEYLALEAAGWKGRNVSSIADDASETQTFREMLSGAEAAGRLEMLRLAVDGRAIAILINFRAAPGSFSYKITYDEDFARYSPGVMIELDNLVRRVADPDVAWMDSCAAPDHPMIDHLWGERRAIGHVVVALPGAGRSLAWSALAALERLSALTRRKQDSAA